MCRGQGGCVCWGKWRYSELYVFYFSCFTRLLSTVAPPRPCKSLCKEVLIYNFVHAFFLSIPYFLFFFFYFLSINSIRIDIFLTNIEYTISCRARQKILSILSHAWTLKGKKKDIIQHSGPSMFLITGRPQKARRFKYYVDTVVPLPRPAGGGGEGPETNSNELLVVNGA